MREPDRIIRLRTVLARTGLSRSTIYRKIAEGTFPPQIKISLNGTGWLESDINRWIADPVGWRPKHELDTATTGKLEGRHEVKSSDRTSFAPETTSSRCDERHRTEAKMQQNQRN